MIGMKILWADFAEFGAKCKRSEYIVATSFLLFEYRMIFNMHTGTI